jgi:hypothetical protein
VIAKANQTITFAVTQTSATFGNSFPITLPTASSGLTAALVATGGCEISGTSVRMTSGTTGCTLTATQGGNNNYNAASDEVRTVTAARRRRRW